MSDPADSQIKILSVLRESIRRSLRAQLALSPSSLEEVVDFTSRAAAQAIAGLGIDSQPTWETPRWLVEKAKREARALGDERAIADEVRALGPFDLDPIETSTRRGLSPNEQAFIAKATEKQSVSVAYHAAPRLLFEDIRRRYLNPPYFVDQKPRRVPHCGLCDQPAHASETNDWGHHAECQTLADAWGERVLAAMKAEPADGAAEKLAVVMRREAVSDFEKALVDRVLGPRAAR